MNSRMMNVNTFTNTSNANLELFRQLANTVVEIGKQANIPIVPYRDESLPHFSKLDQTAQSRVLTALKAYVDIYTATLAEGSSALDSLRVIWNALVQLGYKPTSDLFSFITSGSIIEIHDNTFVQIFRSINFFNLCTYSLEELYCHQITDLYERDLQLETQMMGIVSNIYSGEITNTILTGLKPHVIQEKMSEAKLRVMGHIKYLSPLYSSEKLNHNPIATIAIENAELSPRNTLEKDSMPISEKFTQL